MHHRPIVRCICAICLTLCLALPASAGIYYEATTKAQDSKTDQQVHAWVEGPNAKVEFMTGKKNDVLAPGTYLLTTDGAETLYLVNPEEKTYHVLDFDALLASLGTMMESMGGVMEFTISDTSNEKVFDEKGEEILGLSTQHVRWNTAYTMSMKMGPIKKSYSFEIVQDSWVTDALKAPGFAAWLRKNPVKTGNEEFDELMAQEASKIEGFPLKSIVTTTTVTKKGKKSQPSTSTTEVTLLREESIGAATFAIPDDYERIEVEVEVE